MTTFQSGSAFNQQYVVPVTVEVPGTYAGDKVNIVMAAWATSLGSLDQAKKSSLLWGISAPVSVTLGGLTVDGGVLPPANLVGLQGFVTVVPEPSVAVLAGLGISMLFCGFRRNRVR